LKRKLHAIEKKNSYLQQKIRESFNTLSINIDGNLDTELSNIIQEHAKQIEQKYKPNSFHHLFWTEKLRILLDYQHSEDGIQCLFAGAF